LIDIESDIVAVSSVNQNVLLNILSAVVRESPFAPSARLIIDFAEMNSSSVAVSDIE